jgi:acetyl-CoA carboxylase, biotin carboxylase subunit
MLFSAPPQSPRSAAPDEAASAHRPLQSDSVFRKILIANRGEIALRVMRTLRELGIRSVAVYSDADRAALHVRKADEAAHIGAAPASESYLNIDRIIDAARRHGADAIHPGYGFLSENARFRKACDEAGIAFIGPSARSIELMGSKTAARRLAQKGGAPVVPGTDEGLTSPSEAAEFALRAGFPVMLKAVAGGGGKGMRRVDREQDLTSAFESASSEALRAFGDGRIYVEKLIEHARHIEIQVLGDGHGHLVHLGERECSVQRRHQKVIEESPSPLVAARPELRERMGEAAVLAARAAGYFNAGTVEFLADNSGSFFFLEMNTRLQVEHPVTELVTGLDLVRLQVEIAAGARLPFTQEQIAWRGAALECRIYAEDPANNFFPSAGRITHLAEPSGPGVRLDSGIYAGWNVPLDYDPMLAKMIVWADTRAHAIERALRALDEYHVGGIQSNLPLFRAILNDPQFRAGDLHTGYLDELLRGGIDFHPPAPADLLSVAALAASLKAHPAKTSAERSAQTPADRSQWLATGRADLLR